MKYREEDNSLSFSSQEEVEAFHSELTALVREVTVAASRGEVDNARAVDLSRDVLQRFRTVARALNIMRRTLPRHGA